MRSDQRFDLIELDGDDLHHVPLTMRKTS